MKASINLTIIQVIVLYLLLSCSMFDRDVPVEIKDLKGSDYRLFQNTPAWELAKAVEDGNEEKISEIVAKNPSLINYQDPKYGNTLLIFTIMNQQFRSFMVLLERKADISIHNSFDGTSAIIEACSSKFYDIKFAQVLIKYGANINDVETGARKHGNSTRDTPLIAAARTGSLDIVKFLITTGVNINFQNDYDQSALSESVMVHRYEVAFYLLQNGADYKRPIFYRPDYTIPSEKRDPNDKGKPMYLIDLLKENASDIGIVESKYKKLIFEFLNRNGVN